MTALTSNTQLSHQSCHIQKQVWKHSFMSVFPSGIKNTVTEASKCHPIEKQAQKNVMVCLHLPYSLELVLYNFWLFLKAKMTRKGKYHESIQDNEVTWAVHVKILRKEHFRSA